jgi:hypothetical protein
MPIMSTKGVLPLVYQDAKFLKLSIVRSAAARDFEPNFLLGLV